MRSLRLTAGTVALLALLLGLIGCSAPAAQAPVPRLVTRPPRTVGTPVTGVPIIIGSLKRPLGDPDSWPPVGSVMPASAYTPIVAPDHISGVNWVTGSVNGVDTPELYLHFDSVGTKAFADWTSNNIGKQVVVVLEGKVLALAEVRSGIHGGSMAISAPKPESMRSVLASYGLTTP